MCPSFSSKFNEFRIKHLKFPSSEDGSLYSPTASPGGSLSARPTRPRPSLGLSFDSNLGLTSPMTRRQGAHILLMILGISPYIYRYLLNRPVRYSHVFHPSNLGLKALTFSYLIYFNIYLLTTKRFLGPHYWAADLNTAYVNPLRKTIFFYTLRGWVPSPPPLQLSWKLVSGISISRYLTI